MTKKRKRKPRATRPIEPEHLEPAVTIQEPPVSVRIRANRFWPKNALLPTHYVKARRQPLPCPKCLRIRLDNGAQAVTCMSSGREVAWFRCKECDHRWSMAVKEV